MSEGTEETKKSGFFGKLMKIAFIAAIVAALFAGPSRWRSPFRAWCRGVSRVA